jgi:hypothetical protein
VAYLKRGATDLVRTDFSIGKTVIIAHRQLNIYDCDAFTRDFYKSELDIIRSSTRRSKHTKRLI